MKKHTACSDGFVGGGQSRSTRNCSWCDLRSHGERFPKKKTEHMHNNPTSGWSGTDDKTKGTHCKSKAKASLARVKARVRTRVNCEQYTHECSTYRVAQHDHISSREHAWLKSWKDQDTHPCVTKNNCHPRVMSHSLPHMTLTTNTTLSPISSTSLAQAEWRINTNPISHRL